MWKVSVAAGEKKKKIAAVKLIKLRCTIKQVSSNANTCKKKGLQKQPPKTAYGAEKLHSIKCNHHPVLFAEFFRPPEGNSRTSLNI
jgi:hypothetical protein